MSLITLRAGRGFRAGESNRVEFLPDKGQLEVDVQDGLCRLSWRSRATDSLEDENLLFPEDSKFTRVDEEPSGRTFKLTFASSGAVHFFYLQSERSEIYKRRLVETINSIIDDPENGDKLPKLPTEAQIREHPEEYNEMETD
ncbi:hypothetical protein E3Q22_01360 [Wallemia mellicola]|uniref:Pru domain-containing protein n=2 Tax=Wallemia mellicola TaxID=1708541 RepID=A0A4T0NP36_9BASI|nr:hypothetical protein WALSEDRAFT_68537 [Wallemia mellicola CBS 633.66]TIB79275.1 hypothetical protein E3Q23_00334 [Wallemia mellicola]EIM22056.1 hypothetical protein WALSEDRAFT_68537 [Wallemia mellicola CBS 633.66]TIB81138.1 hypothetical protein E3Q22_01360 [Wallemia mellicola]TIB90557.1 hypothetical protein E3Q19_02726 [Wallemia mellicola]TIB95917.1 hypothetical protein E3Q18_03413 [Wallemia mellicola]|eukprot:XP_006957860.1 hypothetical protein WALSEDRAFT_68537 [Wallemia mellicola CBS 633.66]